MRVLEVEAENEKLKSDVELEGGHVSRWVNKSLGLEDELQESIRRVAG